MKASLKAKKEDFLFQTKRFLDDLNKSWYFRFWLVLWLIGFTTWILGVLFMADRAIAYDKHKVQQFFVDVQSTIQFPRFQLRFPLNPQHVSCYYGADQLPISFEIGNCYDSSGNETCISVDPQDTVACLGYGPADPTCNNRLVCNVNISGPVPTQGIQISYDLLEAAAFGPNSGAEIWISPNPAAWVLLTKAYYDNKPEWERSLLYHAAEIDPSKGYLFWSITTTINTFKVEYYETIATYTGWMAVADVGGFFAFIWLAHGVIMMVLRVCLVNNSILLDGQRFGEEYVDVEEDEEEEERSRVSSSDTESLGGEYKSTGYHSRSNSIDTYI